MARKRPTEAVLRAQKEAKQKKLLLLLVPLLLGIVVWQGPKTYKALHGSSQPLPTPPADVTPVVPTGTGTTPAQTNGLPDTDLQPSLLDGQLISFSRFFGRDPFSRGTGTAPAVTKDAATVQVNGISEDIAVGDSFPAKDPTFKLVSVTSQTANIGLVSGSFSNGASTITINVGETLVLVADDGARYAIKLVSVASA